MGRVFEFNQWPGNIGLLMQPLPPGKYSVDVVQTVARNGHLTINNSLNIVGTAENGWKGSTYKFFGNNSNICTITPAIVTQKISENKLRKLCITLNQLCKKSGLANKYIA